MTALGAHFRFDENEADDDLIGEYATPQDKERIVSSTFNPQPRLLHNIPCDPAEKSEEGRLPDHTHHSS